MKKMSIALLAGLLLFAGFSKEASAGLPGSGGGYHQIDQETAKQMMEQDDGHVIVDVRRPDEFESGHIPGAICVPNESIGCDSPEAVPNYDQILLIYCRSGNRSRQAAEKLAGMGYKNVYEFGGISSWTGEVVTGQALTLTLESNPTTGFCWTAEQDEALFDIEDYYLSEPQPEPVSGSGGWQTFILTPRKAGTVQLTFTYSRPWEPSPVDSHFTYTFSVSDDLRISVTEEGKAEFGMPELRIY